MIKKLFQMKASEPIEDVSRIVIIFVLGLLLLGHYLGWPSFVEHWLQNHISISVANFCAIIVAIGGVLYPEMPAGTVGTYLTVWAFFPFGTIFMLCINRVSGPYSTLYLLSMLYFFIRMTLRKRTVCIWRGNTQRP